jgi:hypothetical protein
VFTILVKFDHRKYVNVDLLKHRTIFVLISVTAYFTVILLIVQYQYWNISALLSDENEVCQISIYIHCLDLLLFEVSSAITVKCWMCIVLNK